MLQPSSWLMINTAMMAPSLTSKRRSVNTKTTLRVLVMRDQLWSRNRDQFCRTLRDGACRTAVMGFRGARRVVRVDWEVDVDVVLVDETMVDGADAHV